MAARPLQQFMAQSCPPKPTFSVDQIPDLSGRVVMVTGGNTGIGYETAKALLAKNAKVYIACRSSEKAQGAITRLREETGKSAHFLKLDLSSLAAIEQAASDFLNAEKYLHILFNNAGVMEPPIDMFTADGYDLQVGTNVLGHYYFTTLILPALLAVAQDGHGKARVVNTSSAASEQAPKKIDYSLFKGDSKQRRKLGISSIYQASKWMTIVFATELSRRYGHKGIVSTSCSPGFIQTDLQRHWTGAQAWVANHLLYPTPYGALTQLYAGASERADEFDNQYFIPWARKSDPNPTSQDPAEGKRLWEWLEAQVKGRAEGVNSRFSLL